MDRPTTDKVAGVLDLKRSRSCRKSTRMVIYDTFGAHWNPAQLVVGRPQMDTTQG